VGLLGPPKSARRFELLDVAGGTGDITLRALQAGGPGCHAVLCDISPGDGGGWPQAAGGHAGPGGSRCLLDRQRGEPAVLGQVVRRLHHRLRHPQRDAHRGGAGEAFRVLKPGGRFLCLEFSACEVPLLDRLYDFHSFQVIPRLGQLSAGLGGVLPVSGGEHPQVSDPGEVCRADP
jgi:demethylmenaquinone methyltransferase/2-methoxy-6-polyprenyl-1,4-benzoquinol methylase